MLESYFKSCVKRKLKSMLPGCIVIKMPAEEIQGIPDMLVLYNNQWAALEFKKSKNAARQPNQEYYVEKMNIMSFARFIYPENEQEVLDDLERFLKKLPRR